MNWFKNFQYKDIYTIEVNLDEDFANACSYHIDDLRTTSAMLLREFCEKKTKERWVIVGLAASLSEAQEKCQKLRLLLCEMHKKKPYGIEEILFGMN